VNNVYKIRTEYLSMTKSQPRRVPCRSVGAVRGKPWGLCSQPAICYRSFV